MLNVINRISETISNLDNMWLGYRYIIVPTDLSFRSAGFAALGISEFEFKEIQVDMFDVPSLSSRKRKIPVGSERVELTLRAPVTKNSSLFQYFDQQQKAAQGGGYNQFGLAIVELGSGGSAVGALPLTMWIIEGCQPTGFTPARGNTNGEGVVPLEEIVLSADRAYRPYFDF